MEKNLLFLIIFFSLISCDKVKNKHYTDQKKVASHELANDITLKQQDSSKQKTQEQIRSSTHTRYAEELKNCSHDINAITDFNGKTEFWTICNTDNSNRIIRINSHEDDNLYEEIYFEQNGALIYAVESIQYTPTNHYMLQPWVCEYFVENGKLISLMSLGHGKTEDDRWDPDIIFEMFRKRLEELSKIAKE